jgi:hypothetical protein
MVSAPLDRNIIRNLYKQGKSLPLVATELRCSVHKVVYWMTKYNIPRRSRSDAVYRMYNPSGDPFKIKSHMTKEDVLLFGLGMGIYLGEGNKVAKHSLRIANTNPLILKLFIKFLKDICQFRKDRMSYSIVCFHDTKPDVARVYWSEQLRISPEKFGRITRIPTQGKGTYRRKSEYGVCTIQANNIKLTAWLREKIRNLETTLPR